MSKNFELRELMQTTADRMIELEKDPAAWVKWITLFLQFLEDDISPRDMTPTLTSLRDQLTTRINSRRWQ